MTKILSRTAIQRMVGVAGGISAAGGGTGAGGGAGADLTGYATEAWVNENYLSIEFFSSLFKAYDSAATPNEIEPNDGDTTAITNIKAMFGFWTEQYLSALGLNSAGGGGGATTLADLLDVDITSPTNGQALVYNATSGKWENQTIGGGSTGTLSSIGLVMPTGFSVSPGTLTEDGSFTVSFAAGYGLPLTADVNKGVTAYGWGNHANAGYLTSVDFSDLTSHPTTLAGYGITDANIISGTIKLGSNSITPLTSSSNLEASKITGTIEFSHLPTLYWADVPISDQSNNNTSPQFGNLRLRPGTSNYGSYLRFGDGDYCYLYENTDDHLKIYSSNGIELLTGNNYNIKLNDLLYVYKSGIAGSSSSFPDGTPFTSYTFYNILRSTTHTIDLFVKSSLNIANNSAIRWQNFSGSIITGLRLNNNNQFEIGYGMAGSNYESRIYGGSTAGIKFYCGESNEVASVYRNTVNNVTYQGLRIGNALLSWDSDNNALKVQKYDGTAINFYSLGGVSALGYSSGGSEISSSNLSQSFTMNYSPTRSGTNYKWHKLGDYRMDSDAMCLVIDLFTGNGYNAGPSQNSWARIMIKKANTSSGTSNSVGVTCNQFGRQISEGKILVRINATAYNAGVVWVRCPWNYPRGAYTVYGNYTVWNHNDSDSYDTTTAPNHNQPAVGYYDNTSSMSITE